MRIKIFDLTGIKEFEFLCVALQSVDPFNPRLKLSNLCSLSYRQAGTPGTEPRTKDII